MHRPSSIILAFAWIQLLLSAGCAHNPAARTSTTQPQPQPEPEHPNPSFPLNTDQARRDIERIRADRRPLTRPLVVVGGFLDPNLTTPWIAGFYAGCFTPDSVVIPVSLGTCASFDECRSTIIAAVDAACPGDDPEWTAAVDVIGISLGGLAARYAAAAPPRDLHDRQAKQATQATRPRTRRLKIGRLFTLSSPHTGATLAQRISLITFHRDMRPGSAFLTHVADAGRDAGYELYPYTLLGDEIVGTRYAAPAGINPWWLPNETVLLSHWATMLDGRIRADILRRLRDEPPFTLTPALPLPAED